MIFFFAPVANLVIVTQKTNMWTFEVTARKNDLAAVLDINPVKRDLHTHDRDFQRRVRNRHGPGATAFRTDRGLDGRGSILSENSP